MSFTYDLSTQIGMIRLFIQDKDPSRYAFEDEELQVFLIQSGMSVYLASAMALRSLASSEAKLIKKYKVGTKSIDKSGIAEALLKQADEYEKMANRAFTLVDTTVAFSDVEQPL